MKKINEIEITNEEIEYYYNETNHSQHECAEHFEISVGTFINLLKRRGIKKDKDKHVQMIKKVKKINYGDENYNNREKSKQTLLLNTGYDNPFKDKEKMKKSYLEHGYDHPMHNEEIKEKCISKHDYKEIHKKGKNTYLKETGYDNPGKNSECIKKMLHTKIARGVYDSSRTSIIEKKLEKLLNRKFSKVISHYRDERYARDSGYMFECDFYIPEEDLFIELNAHDSHYNCPFDKTNEEHIKIAEELKNSSKERDIETFKTWTIRDTEKIECAIKNNLNYIILYPTNSIHNNKKFNDSKYSELIEYLIKKLNRKE